MNNQHSNTFRLFLITVCVAILLLFAVWPVDAQRRHRPDPGQQYGQSGGVSDQRTIDSGSRYRRPWPTATPAPTRAAPSSTPSSRNSNIAGRRK